MTRRERRVARVPVAVERRDPADDLARARWERLAEIGVESARVFDAAEEESWRLLA